jgi:SAM-dependent methyltransferase
MSNNDQTLRHIDVVGGVYDAMADGYDAHDDTVQFLAEDEYVYHDLLCPLIKQTRVVDLGCGTGRAIDWLELPENKYIGYDVSDGMLAFARQKHPYHTFHNMNMLAVPPMPDCAVISLYGSPCYIPTKKLLRLVRDWVGVGSSVFLLLYGMGRNLQTYTAQRDADARPILYDRERVMEFAAAFPDVQVTGVDMYAQNKGITDVKEYLYEIRQQALESRIENIDQYTWVFLHIPKEQK